MSTRLTKKQFEILQYIDTFILETGYSPTYREIMTGLGYKSVATIAKHVDNLVVIGKLQKSENEARSLTVIKNRSAVLSEPEKTAQKFLIEKVKLLKQAGDFDKVNKIQEVIDMIWGL